MRVESDLGPDPIKAKIAEAEKARVHTMLVIGCRDVECRQRERALAQQRAAGGEARGEFIVEIFAAIKNRPA